MTAELYDKIRSYNPKFDQERVRKAYAFVLEKYKDTEGDTEYCTKVLEILLPLKPDEDTIIAVLLHDLYLLGFLDDEYVKDAFGHPVFLLLAGLKKLTELNYAENDKVSQMEVLRKMFLTMARDLRVILIWLACRLCKLENPVFMEKADKLRIARETMNVYVPIASRLGIYRIKTQLEDLSFQYIDPVEYKSITKQVEKFGRSRKTSMEAIRYTLERFLRSKGIVAEVSGRFKSVYSIFRKLKRKGFSEVDQLYDLFAIRVILPEETSDKLYAILGLIHSEWKPISSRFKDYIAVPKPNGYRSLHTVVLGLAPKNMDQPVEIQIRNEDMHREAEYGVASHWLYKDKKNAFGVDYHAEWLRGLEKVHDAFEGESEVMKGVEVDIFKDRIFVLTPRGEVKDLTVGSVPIDFAYAVHTDVGHRCVMSKVNGALVPLDYELKNGDVVEILTRKDAAPKLRWLSMVRSSFARNKIKAWFSALNKENNLREGRELINKQLERLHKSVLDQNYSVLKNYGGHVLNLSQRESLVEEVGKGAKLASDIVRKIYPYERNLQTNDIVSKAASSETVEEKEAKMKNMVLEEQVIVGGESGLPIKIASCCMPKLGDPIVGYVARGNRITVHKNVCRLLGGLDDERMVFANWKGIDMEREKSKCRIGVKLTVVSRVGLIHDLTKIVAAMGINIVDVMIKKASSGLYYDYFLLDLDDLDKFDVLMDKFESVSGVVKVARSDDFK